MNLWALLTGVGLLALNAMFTAAEFALVAARRSQVEQLAEAGSRAARLALAGQRELSLMLAGAQLGITITSLGLGAVTEPAVHAGLDSLLAGTPLPRAVSATLSLVLALGLVMFLHIILGDLAPKSWAISAPDRVLLLLAIPFRGFVQVLRPFIRVLNAASNSAVRALGVEPRDELASAHSPTDLALLLDESAERGTLPSEQQALLSRAIDLSGLDAEAAMVPRPEVVTVEASADLDEVEDVARASGRSRLAVVDGDLDRLVGVLHIKDVLTVPASRRAGKAAHGFARPALLAPESRPLEDLLVDMRRERQHVAFVVDEYGSVTGLIALEDVLEELIGEFEDESDGRGRVQRRADGAWLVPGALRPDELAAHVGVHLPDGEWETLAGYLMASLERMPRLGDRVEHDGAILEVVALDRHRVVQVAITPAGGDGRLT